MAEIFDESQVPSDTTSVALHNTYKNVQAPCLWHISQTDTAFLPFPLLYSILLISSFIFWIHLHSPFLLVSIAAIGSIKVDVL